eukprot:355040-Chlamydomonas_euryale.AAC.21
MREGVLIHLLRAASHCRVACGTCFLHACAMSRRASPHLDSTAHPVVARSQIGHGRWRECLDYILHWVGVNFSSAPNQHPPAELPSGRS